MQKRTKQLIKKRIEKKNVADEKWKIAEKKTKIDNTEKKMKTDKFKTKHMHTIDKKNMKRKQIEVVEIETFIVVYHHQINFFFLRSHRMSNEILLDMKK